MKLVLKPMAILAVVAAIVLSMPLAAQQHAHKGAHKHEGRHGGQVAEAGSYHVEAVVKGETLTIYLTDDNDEKPIATAGFKGLAILVLGGKSQRVILAPVGANALSGTLAVAAAGPVRGAIQITNEKNATVQVKF